MYCRTKPSDAAEIIEQTLEHENVVERLLYRDPAGGEPIPLAEDVPYYARQTRALMSRNALIDPLSLDDYVAGGGYAALAKALTEMAPEAVIDEVKAAGLRGRGGGGFAAARKWASARKVDAPRKYVLCNADEGDPGAFMDCSLLEGNPHSVIEGMIIGAWAVAGGQGAVEGYVYVRNEYPVAVEHLSIALDQARAAGLLGEDILGTGFSYDIRISRGGGSFVCGGVDGPDEVHRGRDRRTPRQVRPYQHPRALGRPHRAEQRGDLGQRAAHRRQGRRGLRLGGHRAQQGNQDLLAGGQGREHGPGRGAHGHEPARDRVRHRRRDPRRQNLQGPCRPAAPAAAACPSRCSTRPWTSTRSARPAP